MTRRLHEDDLPGEPIRRISWTKVLSLAVVLVYVGAAFYWDDPWMLELAAIEIIPLLIIWFPERMANLTRVWPRWPGFEQETVLKILAWIVLLMPPVLVAYTHF